MNKKLPENYALKHATSYSYKITYNSSIRMFYYKGTLVNTETL